MEANVKKSYRQDRVADQVKQIVAQSIIHGYHDDRLSMVTITRAKITPDLSIARIFYTVFGNENEIVDAKKNAKFALSQIAGSLRHSLAKSVNLRHTPRLEFFYDDELEEVSRLEILFHKLGQNSAV